MSKIMHEPILTWVYAMVNNVVHARFLVKGSAWLDKVQKLNQKEIDEGDEPLYPADAVLSYEPVEFDNDAILVSRETRFLHQ